MWFLHAGLNLHRFLDLASRADRYFRHQRPDAVVLVDYPGFNWWIARRAHFHKVPVFYYVPPQIWAWASWRVRKMRRFVDHVLCSLPFEPGWYGERGVHAEYVGHPFFDETASVGAEEELRSAKFEVQSEVIPHSALRAPHSSGSPTGPLVGLLPGSRRQEVEKNFAIMLRAAARLAQRLGGARFQVACFSDEHREIASAIFSDLAANNQRLRDLDLVFCVGHTPRIIRQADACLAVSGSVSLELLAAGTPAVIVYKIGRLDLRVCRLFMKSRYITLVNLLADEEVLPEFLTDRDCSAELADRLYTWLSDPAEAKQIRARLADLREQACLPGASRRAADYIVERLAERRLGAISSAGRQSPGRTSPRRPHFSMGSRPAKRVP
jgi:lipid-A-disaccharide synthase